MVKLSLKGFGHLVKIDRFRAHALTLIFRHSELKKDRFRAHALTLIFRHSALKNAA